PRRLESERHETVQAQDPGQEPSTTAQPPPHEDNASVSPSPDLEAIKAEAFEQGKLETEQAMQSGLQKTLEAFTHACEEVDSLHKNLLEQSRGDMINLVIALSKRIIGQELTTGRDIIVDTLERAIELAIKHNEYDIWLHPDDLSTVEEMVPKLISSVQKLEHITLKTDPDITRGGCKLDSSICTVDATIEAQLETAREFLEKNGPNCSAPEQVDSTGEDDPESP
ncbi:MAG: flagellar assembly protein FliH, partial [Desulfobulbaceae bacterium]|nr:flagellar assembly protein FliH [Desulfobulbaceae bacterium]